ncbi:DUF1992 domain-containing protein, partial [Cellulomonas massiliensis]|uniref:DnaJ family domain-containing protein n=1 Tax=Cellulomonas massiliensis TaxID=1465811 RepID=UPI00036E9065
MRDRGHEDDVARHAAQYRVDRLRERDEAHDGGAADADPAASGPPVVRGRMQHRAEWVDRVVADAVARGEFDDLPLAGKPIPGIDRPHDPDWWLKALVEREHLTGLAPEALRLRTESAELDARLDEERYEARVRQVVEELNARIVEARRQLLGGPPVVTPLRDVEREVERWRARREERRRPAAEP